MINISISSALFISSSEKFNITAGTEVTFPDIDTMTEATMLCSDSNGTVNQECLFDIARTFNLKVGAQTKNLGDTYKEEEKRLGESKRKH